MLNETGSGDNKTVPVSVDQVDNKVAEDHDKIASLEMKIKILTETVKASENITAELEKNKGVLFILAIVQIDILAILMSVGFYCLNT